MIRRRAAALLALACACHPPSSAPATSHVASPPKQLAVLDPIGGWRWLLRTEDQGTSRIEEERWRLRPDPAAPMHLVGRYVRTVEIRSIDGTPFQCNQRPWYRQRAIYDVTVALDGEQFAVQETAYATEPSPCDHGFRHVGDYRGTVAGNRLTLRWTDGTQTLWQIDDKLDPLPDPPPDPPWSATVDPTGPWRWDATSYDEAGNLRDEHEWWELTRRSETRPDATYRRRVTVRSPDGAIIPCAGAPSWSFDDAAYVLDGQREEECTGTSTSSPSNPAITACLRAQRQSARSTKRPPNRSASSSCSSGAASAVRSSTGPTSATKPLHLPIRELKSPKQCSRLAYGAVGM